MDPSTDPNTVELLDEVDHLIFLCDRLHGRLDQVTSYVDQVKQAWIAKRRSLESDSNVSPIIGQKAAKCNRILLNVAEKLAIVELQSESLLNLQATINQVPQLSTDRRASIQSNTPAIQRLPAPAHATYGKPDMVGSGFALSRNLAVRSEHLANDGVDDFLFQNELHAVPKPAPIAFMARNATTLFSDAESVPSPENLTYSVPRSTSQGMIHSRLAQYEPRLNGLVTHARLQAPNIAFARAPTELNAPTSKARVKMQVIKAGTVWSNADIPIADHPSAFFVCNQEPRIAEQFQLMAVEMK